MNYSEAKTIFMNYGVKIEELNDDVKLKNVYHKLMTIYHPDLNNGEYVEDTKTINAAYDVLKNKFRGHDSYQQSTHEYDFYNMQAYSDVMDKMYEIISEIFKQGGDFDLSCFDFEW